MFESTLSQHLLDDFLLLFLGNWERCNYHTIYFRELVTKLKYWNLRKSNKMTNPYVLVRCCGVRQKWGVKCSREEGRSWIMDMGSWKQKCPSFLVICILKISKASCFKSKELSKSWFGKISALMKLSSLTLETANRRIVLKPEVCVSGSIRICIIFPDTILI